MGPLFFSPTLKTGTTLSSLTADKGKQLGLPKPVIDQVKSIEWNRSTFLMELRNNGIHVEDPNNMFEILTKYGGLHPDLESPGQGAVEGTMRPKSGFDFGSAFGMIGGLVNTISDAVNNGSADAFIQNWATQFARYMTDDFGSIQATLNATASTPGAWGGWGAKGALDMLLRFKKTSWADLKSTIEGYCATHNKQVPQAVRDLFQRQADLEASLRSQVNGPNAGAASVPSASGEPLTGSGSSDGSGFGGGFMGNAGGGGFMKYLPWVIGVVVLLVVILLIAMAMRGGAKVKIKNK